MVIVPFPRSCAPLPQATLLSIAHEQADTLDTALALLSAMREDVRRLPAGEPQTRLIRLLSVAEKQVEDVRAALELLG